VIEVLGVVEFDQATDLPIEADRYIGPLNLGPQGEQVVAELPLCLQLSIDWGQLLVDHIADIGARPLAVAVQRQRLTNFIEGQPYCLRLANECHTFSPK